MNKWIYLLLLNAILCSGTAFAESVLTIHVTAKAPLNTADRSGFLDLVSAEALRRIGYRMATVEHPAERGLKNVNAGIDDGEMSRIGGLSAIYPNIIQVPEPIIDWRFVVFSKKELSTDEGWDSLAGKEIAYLNGWKILEKTVPQSSHRIKVRTMEQLFSLLERDHTDFIIYEYWGGIHYLESHSLDSIKVRTPPLIVKPMYMYLNQKHQQLVPQLAAALRQMKQDGTYQRLSDQTLGQLNAVGD
tara:strand:+ start:401 stop:1135 length:735 start_codon:yes stop_codon:yes gene_type:complete